MTEQQIVHYCAPPPQLTERQAAETDRLIVARGKELRELLVEMYTRNGWLALGFNSWEDYLRDLAPRVSLSTQYLRRINNAGLLEENAGYDANTFKEGSIRPISEMLSDDKGFSAWDRLEAIEIAVDMAGSEGNVTANVATQAALYVKTLIKCNVPRIKERMRSHEISPRIAWALAMLADHDGAHINYIIAELSDIELARTLVKVSKTSESWPDILEMIELSKTIPTSDGRQVALAKATNSDLIGYLNEPARMIAYERAVTRTSTAEQIARLSARVMQYYFGGPFDKSLLKSMKNDGFVAESELCSLLASNGYL